MNSKRSITICIILLILSTYLLIVTNAYDELKSRVINYKYVDNEEYTDTNEGVDYINSLPIHFNIINKYFSDINNLSQEEKEQIVLAYAIKNKYGMYNCGPNNSNSDYLCIDKDTLNSKELLDKFKLDFTFKSNRIDIYVDDYGTYSVTSQEESNTYKIVLNKSNNKLFRLYSSLSHYEKSGDKYLFYMTQGYYMGNCNKGEELELYDFMTGKSVYSSECNDKNYFNKPPKNIEDLQVYKYELLKDDNNNFYLYGYNPVNEKRTNN